MARISVRTSAAHAVSLGVAAALVFGVAACHKTITTSVTQPRPTVEDAELDPRSERLHIDVKDMEIPHSFKLRQSAWFVVKNRELMRFHVTLVHKWEEIADLRSWDATLVDDQGRRIKPMAVEVDSNDVWNSRAWEIEQRNANRMGDLVDLRGEHAWKRRMTLQSVGVFKGRGDYVFRAPDLYRPDLRSLTLILARQDFEYRFTWNFDDGTGTFRAVPDAGGAVTPVVFEVPVAVR